MYQSEIKLFEFEFEFTNGQSAFEKNEMTLCRMSPFSRHHYLLRSLLTFQSSS